MYRPSVIIPFTGQGLEKPGCLVSNKVQHVLVGKLQGFAATRSKGKVLSNLIFVASTTSGAGVKFFSLVSKNQELMRFSCKNLDLAFFCVKYLILRPFCVKF